MGRNGDKINILQVIDKFSMDGVNPSSCTSLLADWALYLDQDKFRTVMCGIKKPEPAGNWLEDKGLPVAFLSKSKYSPGAIPALTELIDRENIDILHLHGYTSANYGRIAAHQRKVPSIVHEHAIMKVLPHQYLMDFALRWQTDVAVAVSEAVKRFMVRGRCVPSDKVMIIGNGIRLDRFTKADPGVVQQKKNELNIPLDHKVVGLVTRFREEKGTRFFIDCAKYVSEEMPDTKFIIVGDGPQQKELESHTENLGLTDTVMFTGFSNDTPLMLSMFDVAVIPSLSEGFCLALVEAMAMEKPVVASTVGGILEIAQDGHDALLVPPADGHKLAEKVMYLLNDRDKAEQIAKKAKETSKKYSIENNVLKLEHLYLSLVGNAQKINQ